MHLGLCRRFTETIQLISTTNHDMLNWNIPPYFNGLRALLWGQWIHLSFLARIATSVAPSVMIHGFLLCLQMPLQHARAALGGHGIRDDVVARTRGPLDEKRRHFTNIPEAPHGRRWTHRPLWRVRCIILSHLVVRIAERHDILNPLASCVADSSGTQTMQELETNQRGLSGRLRHPCINNIPTARPRPHAFCTLVSADRWWKSIAPREIM